MATKKTPQVQFLDLIADACCAPRSTIKNTSVSSWSVRMQTKLNRASETYARPLLQKLGFGQESLKGTGSSSQGDFSSDIYGSVYKHPNGTEVTIHSHFGYGSATFHIAVSVSAENALAFIAAAK